MQKLKISPSQIQLFNSCQRRWGFTYIDGLREETTPQQQLGIDIHKYLESIIKNEHTPKTNDEFYALTSSILPYVFNQNIKHSEIELCLDKQTHILRGYADFLASNNRMDIDVIGDFKTTSNIKYAKKERALLNDLQANFYAYVLFETLPRIDDINLNWIYIQTKNEPATYVSEALLDRDTNKKYYNLNISPQVDEIVDCYSHTNSTMDLKPNFKSCNMYGHPCPHISKCNSAPDSLVSIALKTTNTGAQKMPTNSLLEKLKNKQRQQSRQEVNPPEQHITQPIETPEKQPTQQIELDLNPQTEEPKKRTRKTKTSSKKQDDQNTAEQQPQTMQIKEAPVQIDNLGFNLFVSCMPHNQNVVRVSQLVAECNEEIEQEYGVCDFRLIDYGKGAPLLAQKIREKVADLSGGQNLFLDEKSHEYQYVVNVLERHATNIVRRV